MVELSSTFLPLFFLYQFDKSSIFARFPHFSSLHDSIRILLMFSIKSLNSSNKFLFIVGWVIGNVVEGQVVQEIRSPYDILLLLPQLQVLLFFCLYAFSHILYILRN